MLNHSSTNTARGPFMLRLRPHRLATRGKRGHGTTMSSRQITSARSLIRKMSPIEKFRVTTFSPMEVLWVHESTGFRSTILDFLEHGVEFCQMKRATLTVDFTDLGFELIKTRLPRQLFPDQLCPEVDDIHPWKMEHGRPFCVLFVPGKERRRHQRRVENTQYFHTSIRKLLNQSNLISTKLVATVVKIK